MGFGVIPNISTGLRILFISVFSIGLNRGVGFAGDLRRRPIDPGLKVAGQVLIDYSSPPLQHQVASRLLPSSLQLALAWASGSGLQMQLVLDPLARNRHWDFVPPWLNDRGWFAGGPSFLADYSGGFYVKGYGSVFIEDYAGATMLPDVVGLALSSSLQERPWKQTAVVGRFQLRESLVEVAYGAGEGENAELLDENSYGSIRTELLLSQVGLRLLLAASEDGNVVGSRQYARSRRAGHTLKPFAARRLASSLWFDGTWSQCRGCKILVGWQKTAIRQAGQGLAPTAVTPSHDFLAFLPPDGVESMERIGTTFASSYQILAVYHVAAEWQISELSSDGLGILLCSPSSSESCDPSSNRVSFARLEAMTFGVGAKMDSGLIWDLSYRSTWFDRKYQDFRFQRSGEPSSGPQETVNVRLGWNW